MVIDDQHQGIGLLEEGLDVRQLGVAVGIDDDDQIECLSGQVLDLDILAQHRHLLV